MKSAAISLLSVIYLIITPGSTKSPTAMQVGLASIYCAGAGCIEYRPNGPGYNPGSPVFPNPQGFNPYNPSTSPYVALPSAPQLNQAFHDVQIGLLTEGQSQQTRDRMRDLQNTIVRYGGVEGAVVGLSKEEAKYLVDTTSRMLAQPLPPIPVPLVPVALPPGATPSQLKNAMAPLRDALQKRDIFALTEAVAAYQAKAAKMRPGSREAWEMATSGVYTNREGILRGMMNAQPDLVFQSDRDTEEGLGVRNVYNQLLVTEEMLEGGYRNYCLQNGEAACQAAKSKMDGARYQLAQATLLDAVADRLLADGQAAGKELLNQARLLGIFGFDLAKTLVGEGKSILDFAVQLSNHPILTLETIGNAINYAVLHPGETAFNVKTLVADSTHKLLYGDVHEQAEVTGKIVFQILTAAFAPGSSSAGKMTSALSAGSDVVSGGLGKAVVSAAIDHAIELGAQAGEYSVVGAEKLSAFGHTFPGAARNLLTTYGARAVEAFEKLPPLPTTLQNAIALGYGDAAMADLAAKKGLETTVKTIAEHGYAKAITSAELQVAQNLPPQVAGSVVNESQLFGRSAVGQTFRGHFEAGPLEPKTYDSFLGSKYTGILPKEGETFYRIGGPDGEFWSRVKPTSQIQAMSELAVLPTWNDFTKYTTWVVPKDFAGQLYEGLAGNMASLRGQSFSPGVPFSASSFFHGGGNQVVIPRALLQSPEFQKGLLGTLPLGH